MAGVLNLLLAVGLLALNPRSAVSRIFALVLLVRTMSHLRWAGVDLANAAGDVAAVAFWDRIYVHSAILVNFLLLYFLLIYPRRRAWVPAGFVVPAILAGAGGILEVAFLLDRSLLLPLTNPAFLGLAHASSVLFGIAGLVFILDYVRSSPGLLRRSVHLVAVGFALVATYDLVLLVAGYPRSFYYETDLPSYAVLFPVATAAILGGMLLLLGRAALRASDRELRQGSSRMLALIVLPVATAVAAVVAPQSSWGPANLFFAGIWRLPLPLLVSYGLLRTQIFDIDVKVRWTVKQGTMASAFVAVYFVFSEGAEAVVSGQAGPLAGFAAAGLLVLAFRPLRRGAERLARRAVPSADASPEALASRKAEVYRLALEQALRERAALRPEDESILRDLRRTLGVTDRDHATMLEALRKQAARP